LLHNITDLLPRVAESRLQDDAASRQHCFGLPIAVFFAYVFSCRHFSHCLFRDAASLRLPDYAPSYAFHFTAKYATLYPLMADTPRRRFRVEIFRPKMRPPPFALRLPPDADAAAAGRDAVATLPPLMLMMMVD